MGIETWKLRGEHAGEIMASISGDYQSISEQHHWESGQDNCFLPKEFVFDPNNAQKNDAIDTVGLAWSKMPSGCHIPFLAGRCPPPKSGDLLGHLE
jgi:hypothetical protein